MHVRSIAAAAAVASVLLVPVAAKAQYAQVQVQVQQPYQPQQPVYVVPPPPADAQAQNGQYVAPMQQQTQQTYVPQSVALSGPRVIRDWREGEPIPPGYHPSTRMRAGLFAGGVTLFGVPYLISILVAAGNADSGNANAMWIPVLGPFIQMGSVKQSQNCDNYGICIGTSASDVAVADIFLVLDGVMQGVGVAMAVYALAVPKTVLVRNDLGSLKNVMVAPMVGRNITGLGVTGQF